MRRMDLVTISLLLQDWELAKVALSCHMALDILCQEMYEVQRRRGSDFYPSKFCCRSFVVGRVSNVLVFVG